MHHRLRLVYGHIFGYSIFSLLTSEVVRLSLFAYDPSGVDIRRRGRLVRRNYRLKVRSVIIGMWQYFLSPVYRDLIIHGTWMG